MLVFLLSLSWLSKEAVFEEKRTNKKCHDSSNLKEKIHKICGIRIWQILNENLFLVLKSEILLLVQWDVQDDFLKWEFLQETSRNMISLCFYIILLIQRKSKETIKNVFDGMSYMGGVLTLIPVSKMFLQAFLISTVFFKNRFTGL